MPEISLTGLLAVSAIAFAAPLLLGLVPRLRLPAVVLELVAGIAVGPSGLGWVDVDDAVELFALVGLAFLLLLAGLEIDFELLRGRLLEVAGLGFALSFALALGTGFAFDVTEIVEAPLLVGVMLAATSLGVVVPVLKDSVEIASPFGQLVIAGATIADVLTIMLLSLLFSAEETSGTASRIVLLGGFGAVAVAVVVAVVEVERWRRLSNALVRLQDTSAQIRVRGAFLLLAVFVVLAERIGVEAILGAFLAGAVLKLVDRDEAMTHPELLRKLEAVGYGVFIPFFFVTSGLRFDLDALFADASTLARVPLFLAALLLVRGLPAILYRPLVGGRRATAAGLLQATSLGFIVVVTQLGIELELISDANAAALVSAGLLSVLLFPLAASSLFTRASSPGMRPTAAPEPRPGSSPR